jgi:ribosomal protein L37AE/L43A
MSSAGIDYGMGRTNVDPANGIRYGVISQNSVGEAWCNNSEPYYGAPTCPKCGDEVNKSKSKDFYCRKCRKHLWSDECYGDEPLGFEYEKHGYKLSTVMDNTCIMVLMSPYYTFAKYCSPCVPGAGDLDSPVEDGAKSYCLGHDWFEDGKAPYPVYRVVDDVRVEPKEG